MQEHIDEELDKEETVEDSHTESVPQPASEKPQPTLENPKGHAWFNGTSWGLK